MSAAAVAKPACHRPSLASTLVPWALLGLSLLTPACQTRPTASPRADSAADVNADGAGDQNPPALIDAEKPASVVDAGACRMSAPASCGALSTRLEYTDFQTNEDLARCATRVSFDGCDGLTLTFDASGCLVSYATVLGHLDLLGTCLAGVFGDRSWPCYQGAVVTFWESCLIRSPPP